MNVRPSIYAYSMNSNCVHVGIASLPPYGEYYGSKITDTDPFTGCIVQIDNYANNDSKSTLLIYCEKSDLHFLNWDQSEEDSIGLFDTLGIVFCGVVILFCILLIPSASNDSANESNYSSSLSDSKDADLALKIAMIMRTDYGVKDRHLGRCVQDTGGLFSSSECGNSTNNRCPRCRRYACGSCLGSRTYNGRKVCDGCNRSMSGD